MSAKSPTMGVKSREIIGTEQFTQRREVFGKHDTVFLPPASPTALAPAMDVDSIVTSNHGKTTSNFRRNAPAYSSMRESRTEEQIDFRPRKYSDNFYSELNQSDDVDYRRTMTERTRRLSKMRRDFMTSNLHEPTGTPFNRVGTRASLPAKSLSPNSPILKYKIESPNLYKFPFAEPYSTPTPTRKVRLELGPSEVDGGKENEDPERTRHQSLPNNNNETTKVDHQKLFEELVKRYSPQRKTIDWTLPPTKPRGPRVIASVPKSSADSVESVKKKQIEEKNDKQDDDVFEMKEKDNKLDGNGQQSDVIRNGPESIDRKDDMEEFKKALAELDEKDDKVPELGTFQRQHSKEKPHVDHDHVVDLSIPALIQKMTTEGEDLENHSKETKKVKRKRSFLDKLLGRNKKDK